MALVNGTNYDHIDLHSASGGDVTRHKLQDTEARAMMAPTESSSTASAAHAAGSYFIYNNTLYQATADIASGGTITPNTNCKAVTLGSDVSDLKSALTDKLTAYSDNAGFIRANGNITQTTVGNRHKRYKIPSGLQTVYLSGTMNLSLNENAYCALWFVANGAMIEGGYIAQTSTPQTWGMFAVSIPSGAEEIWIYYTFDLYTSDAYSHDIAGRILLLEEETSIIPGIRASLTDRLYSTVQYDGFLKQNGTIASGNTGGLRKYKLPSGITKIYISGTLNWNVTGNYAALWFVSDGAMLADGYVPVTTKPQTWDYAEYNVPSGTEEIWAHQKITVFTTNEYSDAIAGRVGNLEAGLGVAQGNITGLDTGLRNLEQSLIDTLSPFGSETGFLRENGSITGRGATTAPYRIKRYTIPSDMETVYISGASTFDVETNRYCVLWFVQNGEMMTGGNVPVTTDPQTWDMAAVSIPSGAEEIWADRIITLYASNTVGAVGKQIAELEESGLPGLSSGAFTWAKRVLGLRMLADAQGCYFIPFNALGMGVSRGNGENGNDYVADQIHPTALGGYNVACGVWSYLRRIPIWHTSVPATPANELFDGTQWNGKKWYAYGTSLTTNSYGKYAEQVAAWSGMTLTNKAVGGGALVTNRNIYNALLDMEDGKLEADLITIEVGANDSGPLGNPWSTSTNEFFGALNHCIHAMFAGGIQAQVVIMASYPSRYNASDSSIKYDVDRLINN